jgi:hypothetical protein
MLTQAGDIKNIFKGNNSILQKGPKLCNINYDIDGKGTWRV